MLFNLLFISLAYIIIIILEVPRLVVQKMWRDLLAFSILLLPAMVYSYGLALDIDMPNPTKLIEVIFEPLAKQLEQLLGTWT
ncbi:conserved hypothetical protein [Desulforamulus reducens MI-1]|uniref:Uncharacterized protein n=1 Tax=Desulforamulus reducens (strain ATCC BAA-1160 / DSM 100696 / MI-1) TaxID=349161 RepID=A4J0J9_DESRM|nr:hypothetical protein [Desulforamulus reducens]ABO48602.1 conserved hypothetical protein [Desulforamulus reducens MI-1]